MSAAQYFASAAPFILQLAVAVKKPGVTATALVGHVRELITKGDGHPLRTAVLVSAYGARAAVQASGDRTLVRRGAMCAWGCLQNAEI